MKNYKQNWWHCLKKNGKKVDILINNAAINFTPNKINNNKKTRIEYLPLKNWEKEISVGLTGAFLCTKIFGNEMNKNKKARLRFLMYYNN